MVSLSLSRSAERLFVRFARGIAFERSGMMGLQRNFTSFLCLNLKVFCLSTGNGSHCVHEPTSEEWMCERTYKNGNLFLKKFKEWSGFILLLNRYDFKATLKI